MKINTEFIVIIEVKIIVPENFKNFYDEYQVLYNFEKKIEDKELRKIVLIEVPTAIYPDVKKIVSLLFEKSGFKEFNLPEMNFQKLYETKKN